MSNIIGPQSLFQEKYIQSNARIMVVGGAAGSSKSYVGLMRHLRWVHDKNYRGFCIRKNSTAIMKASGLYEEALDLYKRFDPGATPRLKDQKIIFSSGASVSFSHYENRNAANLYHGLQLSGVMYDEASQAEEEDIWWLISRLRTKANVTPSIWLTCNPDPDCYLMKYVEWYLYPEGHPDGGIPDPNKNGVIRYLLRKDGNLIWGDSAEELISRYGPNEKPLSFQGLFGTIYDNPWLLENQPEYKANLEAQPWVDRERLLRGNWFARPSASGFFKREWVEELKAPPLRGEVVKTVRAYDIAGSLKSDNNPDPDYTVSVKMSKLRDGSFVIEDVQRFRERYGGVINRIIKTAYEDGIHVDIILPREPGAAGLTTSQLMVREITAEGFYPRCRPTSKSKIERFKPFAAAAEHHLVKIVKGCCTDFENKITSDNSFFYNELEKFDGVSRKGHDDCADAVGDAYCSLNTSTIIPHFKLPDMSQQNPFRRDYN